MILIGIRKELNKGSYRHPSVITYNLLPPILNIIKMKGRRVGGAGTQTITHLVKSDNKYSPTTINRIIECILLVWKSRNQYE